MTLSTSEIGRRTPGGGRASGEEMLIRNKYLFLIYRVTRHPWRQAQEAELYFSWLSGKVGSDRFSHPYFAPSAPSPLAQESWNAAGLCHCLFADLLKGDLRDRGCQLCDSSQIQFFEFWCCVPCCCNLVGLCCFSSKFSFLASESHHSDTGEFLRLLKLTVWQFGL